MSHTLVIAAVTAMLKDILENELANDPVAISIADLLVTAIPPDRISVGSDERPQLNVFLYQVSQNRNVDWLGNSLSEQHLVSTAIGRNRCAGECVAGDVPLALDLHYLITAYGAKDFQAELLLGYAMQVLHDIPVITQDRVHTALKHAAAMTTFGALSQILATLSIDRLAEQVGTIKLSPEFFSMEETSKLWSSLQTHYRPSAAYQASMVLLKGRHLSHLPQPATIVLPQPTIERVECPESSGLAGQPLILYGQRLQGPKTCIRLSDRSTLLSPQTVQDEQIHLVLPPDLPAGVHGVQVVHLEPNPQRSAVQELSSNVAAFVVQPVISIHVTSVTPSASLPDHLCDVELLLAVKPLVSAGQSILLILHGAGDRPSYRFPISGETSFETLTIPVQVEAGRYWVQLQVDGAQSHHPIAIDLALQVVLP